MKPVNFKEKDLDLGAPKGMENEVGSLPVLKTETGFISCWEPSVEELKQINKTKKVWLYIMGGGHPPVSVEGIQPMEITSKQSKEETTTIVIVEDGEFEVPVTLCCKIGPIGDEENYCSKCGRRIVR